MSSKIKKTFLVLSVLLVSAPTFAHGISATTNTNGLTLTVTNASLAFDLDGGMSDQQGQPVVRLSFTSQVGDGHALVYCGDNPPGLSIVEPLVGLDGTQDFNFQSEEQCKSALMLISENIEQGPEITLNLDSVSFPNSDIGSVQNVILGNAGASSAKR